MSKANKLLKKVTPFQYPTAIHKRTQTPRKYKNYRQYRPFLEIEFGRKCIYCRKPYTALNDPAEFHCEHYLPQNEFEELINEYSNLFFACACCNRNKKTNWSHSIVNPCSHVMSQHLEFQSEVIESKTIAGDLTTRVLKLNNKESLKARKLLNSLLFTFIETITSTPKKDLKLKKVEVDRCLTALSALTQKEVSELRILLKI